MNYTIAPSAGPRNKDVRLNSHRNTRIAYGAVSLHSFRDAHYATILRETSLPWEILETAHALFLKKGFEKTTVSDVCRMLDIRVVQFYNHFDSLDEVLEVLWER